MLKHIVLFKFKEETSQERIQEARIKAQQLLYLDLIYEGDVYLNSPEANPSNYDLCLNFVFQSMDELNQYQVHPEHMALKESLMEYIDKRACIDYELSAD
ncbi:MULTISPECIES: Dabb family protein [Terrabacteria group]|uniref:Dabb family protein n=1 Tax=Bacillati TaxID=1783272 RepID=UPI001C6EF7EE|nr:MULTISPECIES: Dabb family protein [Terrabacteria group]MBW9211820.1 Dabb family protein [Trueperella sp. zg.1013]